MSEELKIAPCPFCSVDKQSGTLADNANQGLDDHWVQCLNCEARGSIACNGEEAIKAWNERPFEKAELNEIEVAEFIADEADRIHPSFDLLAKAICRHFRPVSVDKLIDVIKEMCRIIEWRGEEALNFDVGWLDKAKQALAEYEKGQVKP